MVFQSLPGESTDLTDHTVGHASCHVEMKVRELWVLDSCTESAGESSVPLAASISPSNRLLTRATRYCTREDRCVFRSDQLDSRRFPVPALQIGLVRDVYFSCVS